MIKNFSSTYLLMCLYGRYTPVRWLAYFEKCPFFSYDLYSISGIVMYLVVCLATKNATYNFRLPNGNFEKI